MRDAENKHGAGDFYPVLAIRRFGGPKDPQDFGREVMLEDYAISSPVGSPAAPMRSELRRYRVPLAATALLHSRHSIGR